MSKGLLSSLNKCESVSLLHCGEYEPIGLLRHIQYQKIYLEVIFHPLSKMIK